MRKDNTHIEQMPENIWYGPNGILPSDSMKKIKGQSKIPQQNTSMT